MHPYQCALPDSEHTRRHTARHRRAQGRAVSRGPVSADRVQQAGSRSCSGTRGSDAEGNQRNIMNHFCNMHSKLLWVAYQRCFLTMFEKTAKNIVSTFIFIFARLCVLCHPTIRPFDQSGRPSVRSISAARMPCRFCSRPIRRTRCLRAPPTWCSPPRFACVWDVLSIVVHSSATRTTNLKNAR